jgi:hypothetical protein
MDRNEIPYDPSHQGVPSGVSIMISDPMVRSAQTVHLSSVKIVSISKWTKNKILHDPRHLVVPSCASRMIFEPLVRSAQTVHLSCTNTNIVSKWTEMRFHMTHVTLEFYWVRVKWFSSLWYVWRKLFTYPSSRLALPLDGPKRASTWASSSSNSIRCIQNDFLAYGTFGATGAPIFHLD